MVLSEGRLWCYLSGIMMRIAVCLKYIPDPNTVEVDPLTGAIDASRLLYVINPADESALELALGLRADAGTVLALTVGPARAEGALREALAAGADRVLRLWDDGWAATEPFRTATLLAAALHTGDLPDLILCGTRSADRGTAQVPALLAEHLGWPVVTGVTQLKLRPGQAVIQRRLDRGAREEVEVDLPTVLALEPGLARLRHASLPGLMSAQRAEVPVLSPTDLGLSPADLGFPTPALRATRPPCPRPRTIFTPDSDRPPHERIDQILSAGVTRKSGQILEGPPDEMAAAIIDFLRERGFLESPGGGD